MVLIKLSIYNGFLILLGTAFFCLLHFLLAFQKVMTDLKTVGDAVVCIFKCR